MWSLFSLAVDDIEFLVSEGFTHRLIWRAPASWAPASCINEYSVITNTANDTAMMRLRFGKRAILKNMIAYT